MFVRLVSAAWSAAGVLLVLVCVLELFSSLLLHVKNNLLGQSIAGIANADGYGKNRSWVNDYWKQFYSAHYRWQPFAYWRMSPVSGSYSVDERGLRKTWNLTPASPKRPRIFMFGGSTMWGVGARDQGTIPSHLSRILSESGINAEVVNLAQPGYVNTQEVITLLLELQNKNNPNVVVFYDGINDTYSAIWNKKAGVSEFEIGRSREFNILQNERKKEFFFEFLNSAITNSSTYELWRRIKPVSLPDTTQPDLYEKLTKEVIDIYMENIRLVKELGTFKHFNPLFYWQPLLYTKLHPTAYEKSQVNTLTDSTFCSRLGNEVDSSKPLNAIPEFHNLRHDLDNRADPLYLDYCHLSEKGNEIIARRISSDVLSLIQGQAGADASLTTKDPSIAP